MTSVSPAFRNFHGGAWLRYAVTGVLRRKNKSQNSSPGRHKYASRTSPKDVFRTSKKGVLETYKSRVVGKAQIW